jgi:membrane-bound lytic murein transglycosylase F
MRASDTFWHPTLRLVLIAGLCAVAALACTGCSDNGAGSAVRENAAAYVETGDLADLRTHQQLRLLIPQRLELGNLPRTGSPPSEMQALAQAFAKEIGLTPVAVYVDARQDLIPFLLEGKGDVIVANLTVTPERQNRVRFTAPVAVVHEQVVTRANDEKPKGVAGLAGRRVAVRRSSSYWRTLQGLRKKYPKIELETVPEEVDTETILNRVADGQYDVTIADSNLVDAVQTYRTDLRVAFDLKRNRLIAWALRPDARQLRTALDRFLSNAALAAPRPAVYHEDLPALKNKRKVLRVLTRNSPATYFIWRGQLMGFEYDLIQDFVAEQGLRIEMIVPPNWGDLIPWLKQGRGDVIAASMTILPEREKQGVAFSRPYNYVSEMLVARKKDTIASIDDLTTRTIVVSRSSSYWQTLTRLRKRIAFTLQPAPESMPTSEIIAKVAAGKYDLTVADSNLVDLELTWRNDIKAPFALGEPVAIGWAVARRTPKLLQAINAYFEKTYRGTFYNLTYQKYFKNTRTARGHVKFRAAKTGQLSPYDVAVRRYAKRYGFDWRLITAQMYQESRFNPNARSWAGAHGLMQVMPRTARELGFTSISDPATGIHAGVKYLAWLRDQFETKVPDTERNWFSLAAYNAGWGHVWDARELAAEIGLDRDRWFDHVERAMLMLSNPRYYRGTRYGYVQGSQPVDYVHDIRTRYEAYTRAAGL